MPQSKERKAQYQRDFRAKQKEGTSPQGTSLEGEEGILDVGIKGRTFFKDGIEYVPASNVPGMSLPERPRYLTLSDKQILDRLNPPQPTIKSGW